MPDLSLKKISELDKDLQVGRSIEALPEQINQLLGEEKNIKIPELKNINKIVVAGMGGSNLGARIAKELFADKLKCPIIINAGYTVPAFVDKHTLYILSSYSGTTEEPLSTYDKAKKQKAEIMGMTSDSPKSKIKKMIEDGEIPGIIFDPRNNPCGEPRMGVGYTIISLILILKKTGLLKISSRELKEVAEILKKTNKKLKPENNSDNRAKEIAKKLFGYELVLVGAEFLAGNTHTARNQINESSKNFASYLTLPELNHYSMESLANPASNPENIFFLFFDSKLYHPRISKRLDLTEQVVKKNKIKTARIELTEKTKLSQSFEMLQIASWLSYYLGILNKVDPIKIPWVNWFKNQLK